MKTQEGEGLKKREYIWEYQHLNVEHTLLWGQTFFQFNFQKLLHSKGNHKQNGKTNYRIGENICNNTAYKGLISKTTHGTQYQKMGIRPKQTFLQRGTYRWLRGSRLLMILFSSVQSLEMQIKTTIIYQSPHTSQNGHHQKFYTQ